MKDSVTIHLTLGRNDTGDEQIAHDLLSNNIIVEALSTIPCIAGLISEELHDYMPIHADGSYIVAFDPLDGSKNLALNMTTGSIFAIYRAQEKSEINGRNIVAAMYSVYGPRLETIHVMKGGKLVHYISGKLQHRTYDLVGPVKTYCINSAYDSIIASEIRSYTETLKLYGATQRWNGCLVADFHR